MNSPWYELICAIWIRLGDVISPADFFFKYMRLSNILFAYSEQKKTYTYYLEITFEQKIINKTKFIVLKAKKKLKYNILRPKKNLNTIFWI